MSDAFGNYITSAYKTMMENGHVMESGTIVLDDNNTFSFKIKKLASKKKNKKQLEGLSS